VRGLAYEPSERFASMTELLAAIDVAKVSRTWTYVGIAAVLLVGAAVATIVLLSDNVQTVTKVVPGAPIVVPVATTIPGEHAETPMATAPAPKPAVAPPPAKTIVAAASPPPSPPAPPAPSVSTSPPTKAISVAPPPSTPTKKGPITRHEIVAKDRVPVRVAVHDLGYGGLTFVGDPANDEKETRDQLAAQGPDDHLQRAALIYALGAVQRKKGNCSSATATWQSAFDALHKANQAAPTEPLVWRFWTRIKFAMALCMLEEGRGIEAWTLLDGDVRKTSFGFPSEEDADFHFVAGMAGWETGDPEAAKEIRLGIGSHASKTLELAVTNWAKNVGY
jgi:hypothetical protein